MVLRHSTLLGIVVLLLSLAGCREVSQPALDASGPLFPIEQEDEWGYMTREGTPAIPPQFDRAYRFVDNRALVRQNGQYGFINTNGTAVIPPSYAAAGPFSEGLAPVRPDSLWGFIDRDGDVVIPPQFATAGTFRDGLARVTLQNGEMGYITLNGTHVRPPSEW